MAASYDPQTPVVREWIDAVRDFLTLSEASRSAVFRNLDGAFDPEEIFFVGTQAARLDMPEATEILGRAVDAGYPCWDALSAPSLDHAHPRAARLRGRRSSRRAGAATGRGRLPRGRRPTLLGLSLESQRDLSCRVLRALLPLGACAALFAASPAAARELHWKSLEVGATLDAQGVLHVVERQHMVFTGTGTAVSAGSTCGPARRSSCAA